jgi:hypothetical protein
VSKLDRALASWPLFPADCHLRANQQGSMQAKCRYRVRSSKTPSWEDRLNDLESMGGPLDTGDERPLIHVGLRRAREAEHDLWLDARLNCGGQVEAAVEVSEAVKGRVVDVAPDRRMNTVLAQIVVLVNPIFRPTTRSPRTSRSRRTAAATSYADARSRPESRFEIGSICPRWSRTSNTSAAISPGTRVALWASLMPTTLPARSRTCDGSALGCVAEPRHC